mmetsp:Transcript_43019/g.93674  ORF Transcript_43019/g.93674 Transcript_43019/m.93674 type:complete len:145 (+) Transcript_43019:281-715(+)|eukprot:CAMPEP_0170631878 /NCGR_PEP_ID=MMETSP0224-20130122/34932_1 /TAXON_ID=285029 /ORGANISM="Togula jolla, Strain CCCM 725" /LENGTH=144 /DNA_ID=CAMNT_0010960359 /DNA_START=245 /DNA_END=679 /DNA_ORIENTATION=-
MRGASTGWFAGDALRLGGYQAGAKGERPGDGAASPCFGFRPGDVGAARPEPFCVQLLGGSGAGTNDGLDAAALAGEPFGCGDQRAPSRAEGPSVGEAWAECEARAGERERVLGIQALSGKAKDSESNAGGGNMSSMLSRSSGAP